MIYTLPFSWTRCKDELCRKLYYFLFQIEELSSELEEQKELSAKRLDELEKKTNEYKECLKEVERLKMDVGDI